MWTLTQQYTFPKLLSSKLNKKERARHSTITLKMDRYTLVGLQDRNTVFGTLQDIAWFPPNVPRSLSTDSRRSVSGHRLLPVSDCLRSSV